MLTEREQQRLRSLINFPAILGYLRDELDWPIEAADVEDLEDFAFDYTPEELGIEPRFAARIDRVRQLRDLAPNQPWGIFYIEFEGKKLPVMALRRILASLVRANATRRSWAMSDLLFICVLGEPGRRGVAFAHFRQGEPGRADELRTFSWDANENHFYYIHNLYLEALRWPEDDEDTEGWRVQWRSAFLRRHRAIISTSQMLASAMAEHARTIRELVLDLFKIETRGGLLSPAVKTRCPMLS